MFATDRHRNPTRPRPARRPRVEALDDRLLLSVAPGFLPTPGPPVADVGTTAEFTPPIGSNKGSLLPADPGRPPGAGGENQIIAILIG